jgi:hypothetical protein
MIAKKYSGHIKLQRRICAETIDGINRRIRQLAYYTTGSHNQKESDAAT